MVTASQAGKLLFLEVPTLAPVDEIIDGLADAYAGRGDAYLDINFVRANAWGPRFHAPLCELEEEFEAQAKIDEKLLDYRKVLELLLDLPSRIGKRCLRSVDAVEATSIGKLYVALSPRPKMPKAAMAAEGALCAEMEAKCERRRTPSWVDRALSERNLKILEDHEARIKEWEEARTELRPAVRLARFAEGLTHVAKPNLFRLIGADKAELVAIAHQRAREARAAQAKGKKSKRSGNAGVKPETQLRRLQQELRRVQAHINQVLGFVGGNTIEERTELYVTDDSLQDWQERQERQKAWARSHDFVDKYGVRIPAPVIIDASANVRRSQWYALSLGMRERAQRDGWSPEFITCTLPPPYHSNPSVGQGQHDRSLSPWEAAQELSRRWRRVAAKLRRKIRYFGIRTIQPHLDGTPHLHFSLWVHPEDRAKLIKIFRAEFPDLPGQEIACYVKEWDEDGPADASTYVGAAVFGNLEATAEDTEDYKDRERAWAWAAELGLRKISFVGLQQGALARWRAAYSLVHSDDPPPSDLASEVVSAMRKKHWATAMYHLGLFREGPRLSTVSEDQRNSRGHLVRRTIGWSSDGSRKIVLPSAKSRFRLVKKGKSEAVSVMFSSPSKECTRAKGGPPRGRKSGISGRGGGPQELERQLPPAKNYSGLKRSPSDLGDGGRSLPKSLQG
jgi:hypothetical protein